MHILLYKDGSTFLIYSFDGGFNWQTKVTFPYQVYNTIYFANNNSGFLLSSRGAGRNDPPPGIELLHTMDGGDSWSIEFLSFPFNDVSFINKDKGLACGGWMEMAVT